MPRVRSTAPSQHPTGLRCDAFFLQGFEPSGNLTRQFEQILLTLTPHRSGSASSIMFQLRYTEYCSSELNEFPKVRIQKGLCTFDKEFSLPPSWPRLAFPAVTRLSRRATKQPFFLNIYFTVWTLEFTRRLIFLPIQAKASSSVPSIRFP